MNKNSLVLIASTVTLLAALSGCGGSSDGSDGVTSSANPSGAPSGGPNRFDPSQFAAISECLTAAGLDDVMPSGMPSDMPSEMPSEMPSGMPSGMPSEMPSGMPSGMANGAGGFLQQLNSPKVQEALAACGIALPASGFPSPTG